MDGGFFEIRGKTAAPRSFFRNRRKVEISRNRFGSIGKTALAVIFWQTVFCQSLFWRDILGQDVFRQSIFHRDAFCRDMSFQFGAPWTEMLITAYGAEMRNNPDMPAVTETGEAEITVTYGTFTEMEDSELPPETYLWKDKEYKLKSYQLAAVTIPELTKHIRKSLKYEDVEHAMEIPETADFLVTDEATGWSATVSLPLADLKYSDWRWVSGFEFPVTVRKYEAGKFMLGGKEIPVREEHPFEGYEKELLELIGADSDYYQIEKAEWSGEQKTGEDGQTFRLAIASGQKKVADAEAVYEGQTVIPSARGMAYEAVYTLPLPEESKKPPEQEEKPDIQEELAAEEIPAADKPQEPENGVPVWLKIVQSATTVVLGLGILLVPLLLILLRKRSRSGRLKS